MRAGEAVVIGNVDDDGDIHYLSIALGRLQRRAAFDLRDIYNK